MRHAYIKHGVWCSDFCKKKPQIAQKKPDVEVVVFCVKNWGYTHLPRACPTTLGYGQYVLSLIVIYEVPQVDPHNVVETEELGSALTIVMK
jgi:hypothetical protein